MKAFIIPGYHLPNNIENDEKYIKYFDFACSEIVKVSNSEKVVVILSGGNIDMDKPFDRILSKVMLTLFEKYIDKYNMNCLVKTEEKSLSSLENLIYSKDILNEFKDNFEIYVFSDKQRIERSKILADKVFDNPIMLGVDISHELERQNTEVVNKKEELATKFSLWALKSKENLDKFKNVYNEKYTYLRTISPEKRKEAEIEWWKDYLLTRHRKAN
ncbi:MAG: hypothetical protein US53_C0029G0019 [Candidatus Woesebacteria bacterium GW2011_GWA1_37_7]|uniref:DUF218 domain-containing protein n=1 Tax=Candidatus Woesebacteria bacterium GW2011_GWA1_37_7 TaxID=1618545 RepID=A0A0G0HET0_9BACT|nr:MAG: hypothetical protein US53_C0029G0019 [Candidatus Woesebacteria bacterium GW2011_GWA1_37_7]